MPAAFTSLLSLAISRRFHSLACLGQLKNSPFLEIARQGSLDIVDSFHFAAFLIEALVLKLEDENMALNQEFSFVWRTC